MINPRLKSVTLHGGQWRIKEGKELTQSHTACAGFKPGSLAGPPGAGFPALWVWSCIGLRSPLPSSHDRAVSSQEDNSFPVPPGQFFQFEVSSLCGAEVSPTRIPHQLHPKDLQAKVTLATLERELRAPNPSASLQARSVLSAQPPEGALRSYRAGALPALSTRWHGELSCIVLFHLNDVPALCSLLSDSTLIP